MTNWAFVDYENVGSLEAVKAGSYERVLVFCGPRNKAIKCGSLLSAGCGRIELIGISSVSSNNLDFHLACYLGRCHETAPRTVHFHVISNDTGFDGLLTHLRRNGRLCQRVPVPSRENPQATRKTAGKSSKENPVPDPRLDTLSPPAREMAGKLAIIDPVTRPKKRTRLENWIRNHLNGHNHDHQPAGIADELIAASLLVLDGSKVSYALHPSPPPALDPSDPSDPLDQPDPPGALRIDPLSAHSPVSTTR